MKFNWRLPIVMLVTVAILATVTFGLVAMVVGPPAMVADGITYSTSALRLLTTGVYSSWSLSLAPGTPDASQMPGYSLLLTLIYRGLNSAGTLQAQLASAIPAITLMHFIAAIATVLLISASGRRIGGPRLGWIAGIMGVLYLPFGAESMSTWPENVRLVAMAACTFCAVQLILSEKERSLRWMIAFGVCGGLAVMVQPSTALWLLFPIGLWGWQNRDGLRRSVLTMLVGFMCIALVMAPWIVRNALTFGQFIPLTTHAGTVWLDSVGGIASLTPEETAEVAAAFSRGQDGYQAVAFDRLRAKWNGSPGGFVAWKLQGAWDFVREPWSSLQDPHNPLGADVPRIDPVGYRLMSPSAYDLWMSIIRAIHWTMLALALAGALLMRRKPVVWLLASIPIYMIVLNSVIFPWSRYFYPAIPAVILLASICVGFLVALQGNRRGVGVGVDPAS